jgi:hypothetical protein
MENHKYSLVKRGKSICPECKKRTFVLYINSMTGEPLHPDVGKCDRADNCGHHYTPKQYFTDNHIPFDKDVATTPRMGTPSKPQPAPSYIDAGIFKKSLQGYDNNRLIEYLCTVVGEEATKGVIQRYFIGSSKHWDGSTVFWQIDGGGRVHAGKIMQYDSRTGKRVKDPINKISWVHAVLKLEGFQLCQCLFGEHLLSGNNKTVAMVESEKTAIIASVYLPDFVWLACGGCGNLSAKLCESLKGRSVVLFPDAGKYDEWNEKAKALASVCTVSVSSLIEKESSEAERKAGFDLADYLVRLPVSGSAIMEQQRPQKGTSTEPEQSRQYAAYVSDTGILYIPTPPDGRITFTVYPSVEAYNRRSELPTFAPMQSVDVSVMKQVFINLDTLTI